MTINPLPDKFIGHEKFEVLDASGATFLSELTERERYLINILKGKKTRSSDDFYEKLIQELEETE